MKVLKIITSTLAAILLLACAFSSFAFWYFGVTFLHTQEYGIYVAGVSVTRENKDDILGDGTVYYDSAMNAVVFDNATIESEDTSASVGECIHVTGILEAGEGSSVTASAKKNPAIEAFSTFKAGKGSSITADSIDGEIDVFCHGVFLNYGTTLNCDVDAISGIINKGGE